MLEKSLVLGRNHRVHHHLGQIVEPHHPPFFPGAIEQVGQQLRFELRGVQRYLAGQAGDPRDLRSREIDPQRISEAAREINDRQPERQLDRIKARAEQRAAELPNSKKSNNS